MTEQDLARVEEMAYVGRAPCGCVRALTVDNPEWRRDVAKTIADWVRKGLTVDRVTLSEARMVKLNIVDPHGAKAEVAR